MSLHGKVESHYPITKGDIGALAIADCVSFHTFTNQAGERRAFIRATLRASDSRPFEDAREIDVSAALTSFVKNIWDVTPDWRAFAMDHTPRYSPEWQTVCGLLRAGDSLRLEWQADAASTELLNGLGLHGDRLFLRVTREKWKRPLVFLLSTLVCPQNTARMIQF